MTGRFHEADVQYEKALSLRPNHPQLNYFHGVVLEKLGKRKVKGKIILSVSLSCLSCFFFYPRLRYFRAWCKMAGILSIVFVLGAAKLMDEKNIRRKFHRTSHERYQIC